MSPRLAELEACLDRQAIRRDSWTIFIVAFAASALLASMSRLTADANTVTSGRGERDLRPWEQQASQAENSSVESSPISVRVIADALLFLVFFVLAALAAVMPAALIVAAVPLLILHRLLTSRGANGHQGASRRAHGHTLGIDSNAG